MKHPKRPEHIADDYKYMEKNYDKLRTYIAKNNIPPARGMLAVDTIIQYINKLKSIIECNTTDYTTLRKYIADNNIPAGDSMLLVDIIINHINTLNRNIAALNNKHKTDWFEEFDTHVYSILKQAGKTIPIPNSKDGFWINAQFYYGQNVTPLIGAIKYLTSTQQI